MWNTPPAIDDLEGCNSTGYDQRQRAYLIERESDRFSFSLNGSETEPVLNPCFVIEGWNKQSRAHLEIDGEMKIPDTDFRQGIIRDTDGTETMIIWLRQESYEQVQYNIRLIAGKYGISKN